MCQRAGEQGPPFPTPLLEVSSVLLTCLHLQTLSSPPRKAQQLLYLQGGMVPSTAHLLRVPCLGPYLPCSDSVLGQLPHPGVLLSLVAQASPRLCPPCVGQLCWLPRLQFIRRKGKARPAARSRGSEVGVESETLRSENSFQTLAGSGDPGKPEQPGLTQTKSSSRMGSSQDFWVALGGDPREATSSPWNHGCHLLVSEHPHHLLLHVS